MLPDFLAHPIEALAYTSVSALSLTSATAALLPRLL